MSTVKPQRILIADDNPIMRKTLAQWLRAHAHEATMADRGERAFLALRDWSHPIGWLYTRAVLPGLIDGWILAGQYYDMHGNRPVILAGAEERISSRGDLVLKQPTPVAVFNAIRQALMAAETTTFTTDAAETSRGGLRPSLPDDAVRQVWLLGRHALRKVTAHTASPEAVSLAPAQEKLHWRCSRKWPTRTGRMQ